MALSLGPANAGSQEISGDWTELSEQFFETEEEEKWVRYAPKICSEAFDFGIERFGMSISRPVVEEVENGRQVILNRIGC